MTTVRASRVGVIVAPNRSGYRCARCGITRPYRPGRGDLCRDCQDVLALTECEATTHPTVSVEPMKGGDGKTMVVKDSINLKLPEYDRTAGVYFTDEDGRLHRNDPRQIAWDVPLREVPAPAGVDPKTGEILNTTKEN